LKNENLTAGAPLSALAEEEKAYYEAKYSISKYEELPFCIVIPSFNNVKNNRHINNIKSVLMQDYKNYHIVFIDDASTDGTGDQIEKYLAEKQNILPPERYVIVKNK
jgi:cellulose synthase/poly-beta-1,6-N-acetylglucosamine synthase-like glycosyltransferase